LIKNLQSNPKAFYSYVKSKQKVKPCIGPLEKADGSLTVDDYDVAETLNIFFESSFTKEDLTHIPIPSFRNKESIHSIEINEVQYLRGCVN